MVRTPGRGAAPKRCKPCAKARKLAGVRDWYARNRQVSLDCVCADCSRSFSRRSLNGPLPKRCPTCTRARRNAIHAERQRSASRLRYEQHGRWSSCLDCGRLVLSARKGPRRKRCNECLAAYVQEYRAARAAVTRECIDCADCGSWVALVRKGQSRRRCDPCSNKRRDAMAARWEAAHHDYRTAKWRRQKHRRRAKLRGADSERFNDRDIFVRDRWICQICGYKINPATKYPHPRSASLDHIVPLSEGGAHSRANTRLACWICNSRRGDRGGNEQLALIG
ncbi:HNH endonuclease [Micromonospora chersina]|uniref:HNH endonuclease n=1 Tax=Micromonospora chersina TaxID=47854 RepID=UPI003687E06D